MGSGPERPRPRPEEKLANFLLFFMMSSSNMSRALDMARVLRGDQGARVFEEIGEGEKRPESQRGSSNIEVLNLF